MNKDKENQIKGIGLIPLAALVIGSAIGGGIFGITEDLAHSSVIAALVGWLLVGTSLMMLSLSINNVSNKNPKVEEGIYAYAREGFGNFSGFISGWAYWITCWLGNVAFATLLMSAIGTFIPLFQGGQNIPSIIVGTIFLWFYAWLVNQGVENASILNVIVTIAKLVPLFIFIFTVILLFNFTTFDSEFSSSQVMNGLGESIPFYDQVLSCIMVMMWVFVGIEGASVVGSRAKKKSDVGKATVLGLIGLIVIYVLVSILPYGVLSREQLESIQSQPAMAQAFEMMVGPWGRMFINAGLIISILGAWLSWTILPVETLRSMAKDRLLPSSWSQVNDKNSPTKAIILTTLCTTVFLVTLLFTDKAYNFAYTLGTAAIFITWLFIGLYQVKLSIERKEVGQIIIGVLACLFQIWAILFVALQEVFIVSMLFLPGIYFYYRVRKEVEGFFKVRRLYLCSVLLFWDWHLLCIFFRASPDIK